MKHLKQLSILLMLTLSSLAAGHFKTAQPTGGYFDVYLKNNCSKEVEVKVRADGSTSVSKYKVGEKIKVPVKAGYEIYVEGKLLLKLSDSDSGKDINLCS